MVEMNKLSTYVGHPSLIGSTGKLKMDDCGTFNNVLIISLHFFTLIGVDAAAEEGAGGQSGSGSRNRNRCPLHSRSDFGFSSARLDMVGFLSLLLNRRR